MNKQSIDIGIPFDELVDKAEVVLAEEPSIFQRGGELVHISDSHLFPLKSSIARYMLSRVAGWHKTIRDEEILVHPPLNIAKCLVDKTSWQTIKHIRSVSSFPPIAKDGTIRTEQGYDPITNVFYAGDVNISVSDNPTQSDANLAAEKLLSIVCDFPFAEKEHKSAWLAALLSPLTRFAHDGNLPIVVVQANSPRVGKTTLVKLISYIITGDDCPVSTHTKNEDEERKRFVSYMRATRSIVLVDNIVGGYGGAGINALVTSREFEDRIVGGNKIIKVINDTSWCITGNNITLAPDTAERCIHIRLYSDEEKPHLRSNFKNNDLFNLVKEKRSEYLSAALTIVKAYIVAGMPDQKIPAWGSFEQWSKLVRSSIVFAGFPDPAITREELEVESDINRHSAIELVEGWAELLELTRSMDGITIREGLTFLKEGVEAPRIRAAFEDMTGSTRLPTAHTIARHFREIKDRNFAGKMMRAKQDPQNAHRWFVEEVR